MCLTFWHLTSFWQLDIFLTTWHLFWHMGNGKCGQMGIMVNTEDRDGAPWGMGHMGDGAMGHMVNVVMSLIMCNFLNTSWIFIIILLHIDIDVFYLNILCFLHNGFFKYKKLINFSSNMFTHCSLLVPTHDTKHVLTWTYLDFSVISWNFS